MPAAFDRKAARLLRADAVGLVDRPVVHGVHALGFAALALARLDLMMLGLIASVGMAHWWWALRRLPGLRGFWCGSAGINAIETLRGGRYPVDGQAEVYIYGPLRVVQLRAGARSWSITLLLTPGRGLAQRRLLAAARMPGGNSGPPGGTRAGNDPSRA